MDRPLERRATARTAVVWEALQPLLGDRERSVVDIGGGTGGFAVRIAELGHRVVLIDPSPDALAAAARRAQEHGVADRLIGQQGDLADLVELVGERCADLVLCHGVLGLLDDPAAGLGTIARVLRPGATLSLLVNQRHAAVLARAIAGHFDQARELLADGGVGEHKFTVEETAALLARTGFTVESVHAIRVFADLVPSALLDLDTGATEGLLELERAVADRAEYRTLAAQLHLLARR
jgi:S-adenosylmethionine-dependent methyltransferase